MRSLCLEKDDRRSIVSSWQASHHAGCGWFSVRFTRGWHRCRCFAFGLCVYEVVTPCLIRSPRSG